MKCEWIIQYPDLELCQKLSQLHDIPILLSKILVNRGITTPENVYAFLNPETQAFHDPYLLKDMDKMVDHLLKIRRHDEAIAIYGDYDVDGVTATAMVYSILKRLGWNVSYYIPSRLEEGYGLSKSAIMELFHRGIRNIMTVDCGITSNAEIDYANFLKFKVLITDHHEVQGDIPSAAAIVNPKRPDDSYPFKGLAGVGVAFKVMEALVRKLNDPIDLMEYIDFVTLGTVADIVPLQDENRIIVTKGLKCFEKQQHVGIRRLIELSGVQPKNITTYDIGYKIAPRLNAVGRLESAYASLQLLLSDNEEESLKLARYLDEQNSARQTIENKIYLEAERMIRENLALSQMPILVLAKEGWHAGVIGIVSSRLTAKYYKPTLMISIDPKDGVGRGSARSIEQVNIMDVFQRASDAFYEYGGHPMAAGFTVEAHQAGKLQERLKRAYEVVYGDSRFTSRLMIDAEISIKDMDLQFSEMLEKILPYGQGNPEPVFTITSSGVERIKLSGSNAQHLRMLLRQGEAVCDVVGFHMADKMEDFRYIKPTLLKADTAGSVKVQWHYGVKHLQFFMKDLRLYIDPSTREEENDRKFVFDLLNQQGSADPEEIVNPHVDSGRNSRERFLSRNPRLKTMIERQGHFGYIGSMKVQEEIFSMMAGKALKKGKRVLVIAPSNLFLNYRHHTFKRFFRTGVDGFYNSLSNLPDIPPPVSFATLPMVLNHGPYFKARFQSLFFVDMEYITPSLLSSDRFRQFLSPESKDSLYARYLLGSHLPKHLKARFTEAFGLQSLIEEHIKNPHKGLVDRRNLTNREDYIQKLVAGGNMVMVLVNSSKASVELTKNLGNLLSGRFHNGEVVFYHSHLSGTQRRKIEDLVSDRKVRLLITTFHFGLNMQLPEETDIVLYQSPQAPTEIYALNSLLLGSNKAPIIHLLYQRDQSRKTIGYFNELFPDPKKIENVVQLVCQNGFTNKEDIQKALTEKGLVSMHFWKVYQRILEELGLLMPDGQLKKCEPASQRRIASLVRVQEGQLDRELIRKSVSMFQELSPKEVLNLLGFPFKSFA